MFISDVATHAVLVLKPFQAEMTLLHFIFTVHQLHVPYGTGLEGRLLLADQASPGIQLTVPGQVFVNCQG